MQHYVINFVSDLRQVSSFLHVHVCICTLVVSTNKTEILLKVMLNNITLNHWTVVLSVNNLVEIRLSKKFSALYLQLRKYNFKAIMSVCNKLLYPTYDTCSIQEIKFVYNFYPSGIKYLRNLIHCVKIISFP